MTASTPTGTLSTTNNLFPAMPTWYTVAEVVLLMAMSTRWSAPSNSTCCAGVSVLMPSNATVICNVLLEGQRDGAEGSKVVQNVCADVSVFKVSACMHVGGHVSGRTM